MMQRLFAIFLALPLLLATLAAPIYATTPSHAVKPQHTATPSDAQIEATIRTKLAKSKIGKDGFNFRVQRGVVTWEGSTSVMQHKGSATRMARTAGAAQVINNIQVNASAKAKAVSNLKRASVQPQ
jgi:BON domain-containing protein